MNADNLYSAQVRRGVSLDENMDMNDAISEATSFTLRQGSRSVRSTPTLEGGREMSLPLSMAGFSSVDHEMDLAGPALEQRSNEPTFIIATDFGTTFSSVAFAKYERGRWGKTQIISNYPDDPRPWGKGRLDVPTESWYPNIAITRDSPDELQFTTINDDLMMDIYNATDENYESASADGTDDPKDDDEDMADANTEISTDQDDMDDLIWGYGIQERLKAPYMNHSHYERIARSKLILDNTERTKVVRDELRPILKKLRQRRTIRDDEDVISDYLARLFKHTQNQLIDDYGLSEHDSIEHVLCVPNVWSSASSRKMQGAMQTAIRLSGLGSMENLFIVAEPEAAAAYVLDRNSSVNPDETFLIIDAGGGTVDLTTYTVHQHYPLRLKAEVSKPTGGLYGSSYLNQNFRKHLKTRLQDQTYLERGGFTIDGIVDAAMIEFENRTKRVMDVTKRDLTDSAVQIQGLLPNKEKNFKNHRVIMTRSDYLKIFSPLLVGISKLMTDQLDSALKANRPVKKIILIGGFAGSPSLRSWIKLELNDFSKSRGTSVKLIDYQAAETAVALGAVLRALDKEDGPKRITRSSYGFLRTEEQDEKIPAHSGLRPRIDKLDGKKYIRNTVNWLVKVGEEVPSYREYPIEAIHTFPTAAKRKFMCEEVVYVSDTSFRSHYRVNHAFNKGAEIAGRIVADMTFLKTQGIIQPVEPEPGTKGKRHYKVEIELVMIIDGRNLRFEARWPAGGAVQERGQISIAAAFEPGTN